MSEILRSQRPSTFALRSHCTLKFSDGCVVRERRGRLPPAPYALCVYALCVYASCVDASHVYTLHVYVSLTCVCVPHMCMCPSHVPALCLCAYMCMPDMCMLLYVYALYV